MNLRLAITMATVSFFNATYAMDAMDADDSKMSFISTFKFGIRNNSLLTEYPAQLKALESLTLANVQDPEDRGCLRMYRPIINKRISKLSQALRKNAPICTAFRKTVIDLELETPCEVYAKTAAFYHDAITKQHIPLMRIPKQEMLSALQEAREFFEKHPQKEDPAIKKHRIKLHDVNGTLAQQAQSFQEALPHLREVVEIHPTDAMRNTLAYTLLGVAHQKLADRKSLCQEAQQHLSKIAEQKLNKQHVRFHKLLSAELSNLKGDYEETLEVLHPLHDDPSAQMYIAAAHFFKKEYVQGLQAVTSACATIGPTPELIEIYKRSRCKEAMAGILRREVVAHALKEQVALIDRHMIAQFGDKIVKAEQSTNT